jgi:phage tail-like protein
MARRRRWEDELERKQERSGKPKLADLDASTRAGVLEELQRAGGNSAVQRVFGAELQRDTATAEKPTRSWTGSTHTTRWALSIDGKIVGGVRSVEGFRVQSEVVEATGSGGISQKHLGSVQFEPGVLQLGLGMGQGFFEWIRDVFSAQHGRKDLILHAVDASGHETAQLELAHALLTKVEVPQLAADDASPAWLTLTIAPERVKWHAGSGAKIDAKLDSDPLTPSTVRFEVEKIGRVSELTSVAPWSFEQGAQRLQVGRVREAELKPTESKVGNLMVSLSEAGKGTKSAIAAFDAWADNAMIKGNADDDRTAVLTVSSKGGKKLELRFSGVGIMSAELLATSEASRRRYGLYVERVTLASP